MIPLLIGMLASGQSAIPQQQPMMHSHHSHYQQQLPQQFQNNFSQMPQSGGGQGLLLNLSSVGQGGCPPASPYEQGSNSAIYMSRLRGVGGMQGLNNSGTANLFGQGGNLPGGFQTQGAIAGTNQAPVFFSQNGQQIQSPIGSGQFTSLPCPGQDSGAINPPGSDQDLVSQLQSLLASLQNGSGVTGDASDNTSVPPPTPIPTDTNTSNPTQTITTTTTTNTSLSPLEAAVLQETNNVRAQNNLPALTEDDTLSSVARAHSLDMLQNNYFDHNDKSGCTPSCRLTNAGFQWQAMGENIHMMSGFNLSTADAAKKIINDWMNSPGHRANLLNNQYTKVGVGIAQQGDTIYTTSDYALPR